MMETVLTPGNLVPAGSHLELNALYTVTHEATTCQVTMETAIAKRRSSHPEIVHFTINQELKVEKGRVGPVIGLHQQLATQPGKKLKLKLLESLST
jgi:hypothetical protein